MSETTQLKYEIDYTQFNNTEEGRRLYRVKALRDIPKHNVKAGDYGGWVENPNNLSQWDGCWIKSTALVYGEETEIAGDALISDFACVCDGSKVSGIAKVSGHAMVRNSTLTDWAKVEDSAVVADSTLKDSARVAMNATVSHSTLSGTAEVTNSSEVVYSDLHDCTIWGTSVVRNSTVGLGCHIQDGLVDNNSELKRTLVSVGSTVTASTLENVEVIYGSSVNKMTLTGEKLVIKDHGEVGPGSCMILGPFPNVPRVLLYRCDCTLEYQIVGAIDGEVLFFDDLISHLAEATGRNRKEIKKLLTAARKFIWGKG